jgi:hypothetical protein
MADKKRDYKKEYRQTHGTPKGIADRTSRVLARRKLEKEGRVKKGDGREVDHKDMNPRNNSSSNLRVVDKKTNRKRQPKRG